MDTMNAMGTALVAVTLLAPAAPATAESLADIGWLAGCWAAERSEPGTEEHWMRPAGGLMLGMSRTVRGGRAVEHEFLAIREIAPGRLAYHAQPSGKPPAVFPLAHSGPFEVVFENPQHDFPQRILYRREGDRLFARIEGKRNGEERGIDFPMRRTACEPAATAIAPM